MRKQLATSFCKRFETKLKGSHISKFYLWSSSICNSYHKRCLLPVVHSTCSMLASGEVRNFWKIPVFWFLSLGTLRSKRNNPSSLKGCGINESASELSFCSCLNFSGSSGSCVFNCRIEPERCFSKTSSFKSHSLLTAPDTVASVCQHCWLCCVGDVLVWGVNNSLNKHPFSLWLPSKGNTNLGCSDRSKKKVV